MKILVLNCGSSSLKCQLLDMESNEAIVKGNYERIGSNNSALKLKIRGNKSLIEKPAKDHVEAIRNILELLVSKEYSVIESLDEIKAIGHRIVHGGEKYKESVLIDDEVIENIKSCITLAPIHNPAGLSGINACKELLPKVPMVAAFDTAFHQTMPEKTYIYQLPYKLYTEHKVRKYGFHGCSHRYVASRIQELLGRYDLKHINCHLGAGASLCAIDSGVSVDTTMGMTPLAGIPMGTRSGDIDPSIIPMVMKLYNLKPDEMLNMLNKESGALGVSGVSDDFRDIEKQASLGDKRAMLALESRAFLIAQYVAKMIVSLQGVDVLTFSGGIGENGMEERERICKYLNCFGIKIDNQRNDFKGKEEMISSDDSKVKVYVVPTNEELIIAKDTYEIVKGL